MTTDQQRSLFQHDDKNRQCRAYTGVPLNVPLRMMCSFHVYCRILFCFTRLFRLIFLFVLRLIFRHITQSYFVVCRFSRFIPVLFPFYFRHIFRLVFLLISGLFSVLFPPCRRHPAQHTGSNIHPRSDTVATRAFRQIDNSVTSLHLLVDE